jgi:hypothetical protein
MSLRRLAGSALVAALLAMPVQAMAKDQALGKVIAELNDPARQDAMAGALEALGSALLDMKVAPFLKALDRAGVPAGGRDVRADATLADLAGPDARRMPGELADKLPLMMGMMGTMAGEMETMLPQLEAMGKRLEGSMGEAMRRDRRRRD